MTEQFDEMTVIALRKFAKENGIKLPAGLDKQGIIDKITAEYSAEAPVQVSMPEAAVSPAATDRPVRKASIITDDEGDDDEPVLTVNAYRPSVPAAVRTAAPAAPAVPKQGSSLSTISSKAPAFTMEGARAWHNPRSYNPAPTQSYARTQWSTKPVYPQENPSRPPVRTEESRSYPVSAPRTGFGPASQEANEFAGADHRAHPQEAALLSGEAALQHEFAKREMYSVQPESAEQAVDLLASGECKDADGILDVLPSGYGYIRINSLIPGKDDVYISPAQIKRHALRQGDRVLAKQRPIREGERYGSVLCITEVNGLPVNAPGSRAAFEDLTPIYPKKKIRFADHDGLTADVRLLDLISPIGFGQRALLSVPAHAGKTTLLRNIAVAAVTAAPEASVLCLLLDEKPEEITEASLALPCPVYATAADQGAEMTVRTCELALENAMRLCELKQHAILIVDSLDAVMNAYNCLAPQSSRTLTGSMSAYAMQNAKKFFAAARNTKEGGSITIIAACDPAGPLYAELGNVANMTAALDKSLTAAGVFPPVDLTKCATRKAELMLTKQEAANIPQLQSIRSRFSAAEAIQHITFMFDKALSNAALTDRLESWLSMMN